MKSLSRRNLFSLGASALTGVSLLNASEASLLLKIDISNPSMTRFIGTGAAPLTDDTGGTVAEGVTLLGFFLDDPGDVLEYLSGDGLSAASGGQSLTTILNNSFFQTGANSDLNISGSSIVNSLLFYSDTQAFEGEVTVNLGLVSYLPEAGIGYIRAGDGVSYSGEVLGTYEVIPEPSVSLLIFAGVAGIGFNAYRRRKVAGNE